MDLPFIKLTPCMMASNPYDRAQWGFNVEYISIIV